MRNFYLFICLFMLTVLTCASPKIYFSTGNLKLQNVEKSELIIEDINKGIYFIEFKFKEVSVKKLRSEHFENAAFEIKISNGMNEISKNINVNLEYGSIGESVFLFNIPKDFRRNSIVTVSIENVMYSEGMEEYYNELRITLRKRSKYFH